MNSKLPFYPEKSPKLKDSAAEELLQNILLMSEIGIDLNERCNLAEKYVNHLKIIFAQANKTVESLQSTSKYLLQNAKKLLNGTVSLTANPNIRYDCEKLLGVIDRHLIEFDAKDADNDEIHLGYISEKIKYLELRQRGENLPPSGSNKSLKCDIDEKYPENWSRDSSIDLNNVVNLPPVPEDVFTSFAHKPNRSSSLSSLKSMRKVKLFLQRAETSDDEELSSDNEEHDLGHKGDSDDSPKKYLGNIKEDTQY